jgi:predicted nucleotidyltransferase
MRTSVRNQIKKLAEQIAREFQPDKIILFGSHAYGRPGPDSDVDLLVIMRFRGRPVRQAITILNKLNVLTPVDLLVRTPEQVQERLAMGDHVMLEILERGKVM